MKSLKLIGLFTFITIFTACDKEYICTCTDDQTGDVTNVSNYDLSQSNAESACSNAESAGITCVLEQN